MSCTSCVNSKAVKYYLECYKTRGVETYVFRLSPKHDWEFINKKDFNKYYKRKIKRRKNAEYFHIKEFKRD